MSIDGYEVATLAKPKGQGMMRTLVGSIPAGVSVWTNDWERHPGRFELCTQGAEPLPSRREIHAESLSALRRDRPRKMGIHSDWGTQS